MTTESFSNKNSNRPPKTLEWIKELDPYFQKRGVKKVTMNDVSKLLNVSKATIYKYFKNKEELVSEVLWYRFSPLRYFEKHFNNDSVAFIDRYYKGIAEIARKFSGLSTKFLSDLKESYPKLWESVNNTIEYILYVIQGYYNEGIKRGIFKNVDISIMINSDRFFFEQVLNPVFLKNNGLTAKGALEQYFKMKLKTIISKMKNM
ncbi:MAG: TetR/AcrR family transcriptional regulator, partial [Flavobacteriales bacterium]